jgi:hypothetical protein
MSKVINALGGGIRVAQTRPRMDAYSNSQTTPCTVSTCSGNIMHLLILYLQKASFFFFLRGYVHAINHFIKTYIHELIASDTLKTIYIDLWGAYLLSVGSLATLPRAALLERPWQTLVPGWRAGN